VDPHVTSTRHQRRPHVRSVGRFSLPTTSRAWRGYYINGTIALAREIRSILFLPVFVDSSKTVQDHIGELASSWRGVPTVSGVRPDLCSLDQAEPVIRFGGRTMSKLAYSSSDQYVCFIMLRSMYCRVVL